MDIMDHYPDISSIWALSFLMGHLTTNGLMKWDMISSDISGQIIIIHQPELRPFWDDSSY